jgi:hypothetical protein
MVPELPPPPPETNLLFGGTPSGPARGSSRRPTPEQLSVPPVPPEAHEAVARLGRRFDAVGTMTNHPELQTHSLELHHKDGTSSALHWSIDGGEVGYVSTSENHRRKGVAAAMAETAYQMSQDHESIATPTSSRFLTGSGQRFSAAMMERKAAREARPGPGR